MRTLLHSRLARRSAVTLAAALLGLALAEGLASGLRPPAHPRTVGVLLRASQDRVLETENVPGARQEIIYRDRAGAEVRSVEHMISASGWRGPAFSQHKPPGVFRIICVGDSHTLGHGVGEDETWPRALERALNLGQPSPRFEVLNFGVGGYGGAQKVALIERRALASQPDVVLLQLYMNDVEVGPRNLARHTRRSPLLRLAQPNRGGWVGALRERSGLCELVLSSLFSRQCLASYMGANAAGFEDSNPHWRQLQARILECRARLEQRGVKLMVVLYPLLFEQSGQLASHGVGHAVGDFCARESIPFVDLEPTFLGRPLTPLRIHPLDYHVTGEAHALAARATAEGLRSHGLLEGAAGPGHAVVLTATGSSGR